MRRPLVAFLSAEMLSMTGSQLSFVTIPWLVLVTTGSAAQTGLVSLAEMAPYVLAGLLGGPLVDRFGPRRAVLTAEISSAVAVAAIPVLHSLGALSFPLLLGLVAVVGTLRGVSDTSKRTLLPRAAEASSVPMDRATSLYDGVTRSATLLALPLSGVLILWMGAANVLYIDAASFLVSAALVAGYLRVGGTSATDPDGPRERYVSSLLVGLSYLRRDRLVLGIVGLVFMTNLFDQAYAVVFVPVWVRDTLGNVGALGFLGGAFGLGAVVGNVVYAALQQRLSRFATLGVCFLLGGSSRLFALVLTDGLWVAVSVSFAAGILMSTVNPIMSSTAYERVPQEMHGRVLGAIGALTWAGMPIGGVLAGWAVEAIGLTAALLCAATGYLLVTLLPFVFPVWRQLDDRRQAGDTEPVPSR
jgi:MFS family permease